MNTPRVVACLAVLLSLAVGAVAAQEAGQHHDPIEANLFPPELVMRFQQKIGLDAQQKDRLREEVGQAQVRFSRLQWDLQEASEVLIGLLADARPDEKRVAEQVDRVLDAEREIKQTQILLMVRIKNILTAEQQQQLQGLRRSPPTGG